MDDLKIVYYQRISNIGDIVQEVLKDKELSLFKLDNLIDIYNLIGEDINAVLLDVNEEGLNNEYVYLNDYFDCQKIYVFETYDDLRNASDFLSKFNIHGLFRGEALEESIRDILSKNEILESSEEFVVVEDLEIETQVNILVQVDSVSKDNIIISGSAISDYKEFGFSSLFLKSFNLPISLETSKCRIEKEQFVIEEDMTDVLKSLEVFEFKHTPQVKIAYISKNRPDYKVFHELGIRVHHYQLEIDKEVNEFVVEEPLVIVDDDKISAKKTSGTEVCTSKQFENKRMLIFNRKLPEEKYVYPELSTTTENLGKFVLEKFIEKNVPKDEENGIFTFDKKTSLGSAVIKAKGELLSLNENYIKVILPFRLECGSKVSLNFLGDNYLTVVESEASQRGFLTELHVGILPELQMNKLRRTINTLFFLNEKTSGLKNFYTIEDVEGYIYKEEEGDE